MTVAVVVVLGIQFAVWGYCAIQTFRYGWWFERHRAGGVDRRRAEVTEIALYADREADA